MKTVSRNVTHHRYPSFDNARSILQPMISQTCWKYFHGHPGNPTWPLHLTEPNWSYRVEWCHQAAQNEQSFGRMWLVAELLQFAPDNVVTALLGIMNQILHTGEIPSSWKRIMFQWLPTTENARTTRTSGPLLILDSGTKRLHTWSWGESRSCWNNLKNSILSKRTGGLRRDRCGFLI